MRSAELTNELGSTKNTGVAGDRARGAVDVRVIASETRHVP